MMQNRRRMLMNMASALPPKDTLENTSWANIAIVAAAGKASEYWTVGDTKTVTFGSSVMGSTSVIVRIVGFDYDDLADGSGKAPITFDMQNCFTTMQTMNSASININGWGGCAMRTALINTVLPALENAIGSGIIKPTSKRTSAGSMSTTINTTTDSVWLFSEYELFGTTINSVAGEKPVDKSICYPAFTNNASRIKRIGSTASEWWMRSPYASTSNHFCVVGTNGATSVLYAGSWAVAAIGFCV